VSTTSISTNTAPRTLSGCRRLIKSSIPQLSVFKPLDRHGGTRNKVEGEDRHDLEPEGTHKDTRHKIYTGSGSQSSYPTSCLE
jgi:hypothetical protein